MRMERWLYVLPLRLRSLFRRKQVEQELNDELQDHLEQQTREYIAQGMTSEQARQAALRAIDGLAQRKEECRDTRRVNLIENFLHDLRYAVRVLANAPGFTAVAAVPVALAIGAEPVGFCGFNAPILRP